MFPLRFLYGVFIVETGGKSDPPRSISGLILMEGEGTGAGNDVKSPLAWSPRNVGDHLKGAGARNDMKSP